MISPRPIINVENPEQSEERLSYRHSKRLLKRDHPISHRKIITDSTPIITANAPSKMPGAIQPVLEDERQTQYMPNTTNAKYFYTTPDTYKDKRYAPQLPEVIDDISNATNFAAVVGGADYFPNRGSAISKATKGERHMNLADLDAQSPAHISELKSGYLKMKVSSPLSAFKAWKNRFVVLKDDGYLYRFPGAENTGDFEEVYVVKYNCNIHPMSEKECRFRLELPNRSFLVEAENPTDYHEWMNVLKQFERPA